MKLCSRKFLAIPKAFSLALAIVAGGFINEIDLVLVNYRTPSVF
jgi:hypothetical protein